MLLQLRADNLKKENEMAQLNFNATNVKPADTFEPLPAGWYFGVIEEAELKPTAAGTGSYLALKVKVKGPTNADRVVFANITYANPNEKAVEIGHRQISAICHAIGVLNLTDTGMLCNRLLQFKLKIKPVTYAVDGKPESGIKYEASNEVSGWKAAEGGAPAPGVAAPASAPANAPAAAAKPAAPWG